MSSRQLLKRRQIELAEYTAIYEAANALVELLRANMTPEPVSKRELISLCSPYESENNQLTVYLFHIDEDQHSTQQGYFQQGENLQRAYPTGLTLSFLITAQSKAPTQLREADQYRMLGNVVQILHDHPIIESEYLTGSLKDSGASLHILIERLPHEQMVKIWNNSSMPYKLSLVVKLTGVSIDSERTRHVKRVESVDIGVDRDG